MATWHVKYQAAVLETDRDELANKVAEAEEHLQRRLAELAEHTDYVEYESVLRSLEALVLLKSVRLPYLVSYLN